MATTSVDRMRQTGLSCSFAAQGQPPHPPPRPMLCFRPHLLDAVVVVRGQVLHPRLGEGRLELDAHGRQRRSHALHGAAHHIHQPGGQADTDHAPDDRTHRQRVSTDQAGTQLSRSSTPDTQGRQARVAHICIHVDLRAGVWARLSRPEVTPSPRSLVAEPGEDASQEVPERQRRVVGHEEGLAGHLRHTVQLPSRQRCQTQGSKWHSVLLECLSGCLGLSLWAARLFRRMGPLTFSAASRWAWATLPTKVKSATFLPSPIAYLVLPRRALATSTGKNCRSCRPLLTRGDRRG